MKTHFAFPVLALVFGAAIASAHTGAQGVVLQRMQGMTALADAMKSIAPMVRRQADYDEDAVAAAGQVIAMHSGDGLVDLFVEGTDAAPSEASPLIWADPEEFSALSNQLAALGDQLAAGAASPDDTARTFVQIGQACVACHEGYRIKRD